VVPPSFPKASSDALSLSLSQTGVNTGTINAKKKGSKHPRSLQAAIQPFVENVASSLLPLFPLSPHWKTTPAVISEDDEVTTSKT